MLNRSVLTGGAKLAGGGTLSSDDESDAPSDVDPTLSVNPFLAAGNFSDDDDSDDEDSDRSQRPEPSVPVSHETTLNPFFGAQHFSDDESDCTDVVVTGELSTNPFLASAMSTSDEEDSCSETFDFLSAHVSVPHSSTEMVTPLSASSGLNPFVSAAAGSLDSSDDEAQSKSSVTSHTPLPESVIASVSGSALASAPECSSPHVNDAAAAPLSASLSAPEPAHAPVIVAAPSPPPALVSVPAPALTAHTTFTTVPTTVPLSVSVTAKSQPNSSTEVLPAPLPAPACSPTTDRVLRKPSLQRLRTPESKEKESMIEAALNRLRENDAKGVRRKSGSMLMPSYLEEQLASEQVAEETVSSQANMDPVVVIAHEKEPAVQSEIAVEPPVRVAEVTDPQPTQEPHHHHCRHDDDDHEDSEADIESEDESVEVIVDHQSDGQHTISAMARLFSTAFDPVFPSDSQTRQSTLSPLDTTTTSQPAPTTQFVPLSRSRFASLSLDPNLDTEQDNEYPYRSPMLADEEDAEVAMHQLDSVSVTSTASAGSQGVYTQSATRKGVPSLTPNSRRKNSFFLSPTGNTDTVSSALNDGKSISSSAVPTLLSSPLSNTEKSASQLQNDDQSIADTAKRLAVAVRTNSKLQLMGSTGVPAPALNNIAVSTSGGVASPSRTSSSPSRARKSFQWFEDNEHSAVVTAEDVAKPQSPSRVVKDAVEEEPVPVSVPTGVPRMSALPSFLIAMTPVPVTVDADAAIENPLKEKPENETGPSLVSRLDSQPQEQQEQQEQHQETKQDLLLPGDAFAGAATGPVLEPKPEQSTLMSLFGRAASITTPNRSPSTSPLASSVPFQSALSPFPNQFQSITPSLDSANLSTNDFTTSQPVSKPRQSLLGIPVRSAPVKLPINMMYFYTNLLNLFADCVRENALKTMRSVEMALQGGVTSAATSSFSALHHHSGSLLQQDAETASVISNASEASGVDGSLRKRNSLAFTRQSSTRKLSMPGTTPSVASASASRILVPTMTHYDAATLLRILSLRSGSSASTAAVSLDVATRQQVHSLLCHALRIAHIDEFFQPVNELFEASRRVALREAELTNGERLWDITSLFLASQTLIYLFAHNASNSKQDESESTHTKDSIAKLRSLHAQLQQCIIYFHVQQPAMSESITLSILSLASEECKDSPLPRHSLLDRLASSPRREDDIDSRQAMESTLRTLPTIRISVKSLCSDCQIVSAKLMSLSLPQSLAMVEIAHRSVLIQQVISRHAQHFKSIHKLDSYKYCKRFVKAFDELLDCDVSHATTALHERSRNTSVGVSNGPSLTEQLREALLDLQMDMKQHTLPSSSSSRAVSPSGTSMTTTAAVQQKTIRHPMLLRESPVQWCSESIRTLRDRIHTVLLRADDVYQRTKTYRDTLFQADGKRQDVFVDDSDDNDSDSEVPRPTQSSIRLPFVSSTTLGKEDAKRLDTSLQQLFNLKEELRKRAQIAISNVVLEDFELFAKSHLQSSLFDSFACKLFDSSLKATDVSFAVLLLRSQSLRLLRMVFTHWPSFSLVVPVVDTVVSAAAESNAGNLSSVYQALSATSLRSTPAPPLPAMPSSSAGAPLATPQRRQSLSATLPPQSPHVIAAHSPIAATSSAAHVVETSECRPTNEVNLQSLSFQDTRSLRRAGFTLLQLKESKIYSWSELLSAGYPLHEIKSLRNGPSMGSMPITSTDEYTSRSSTPVPAFASKKTDKKKTTSIQKDEIDVDLTVLELHQAGYSIEQCISAGFDATSLRAGGFDELQLVQSGLFSIAQLKKAGCDVQRFALRTLFDATNGKYWRKKDNWCSKRPLSEWYGIRVDGRGNVVRIDLRNNELEGPLPEALCLLTQLEYLDLFNNHLTEVSPSIGKLTSLRDLWLDNNHINMKKSELQSLLPNTRIRL